MRRGRCVLGAAADDLNVYEMVLRAELGREIAKRNSFIQCVPFSEISI